MTLDIRIKHCHYKTLHKSIIPFTGCKYWIWFHLPIGGYNYSLGLYIVTIAIICVRENIEVTISVHFKVCVKLYVIGIKKKTVLLRLAKTATKAQKKAAKGPFDL